VTTSKNSPPKARRADEQLEEYVGDLYRALGYTVERDVLLHGNQIDLLVSRSVAGAGAIRIAIEVKHRSSPVSKDDVNQFIAVSRRLLENGTVSKCVMVTDTTYTRFGREAVAGDSRIELTDARTLARQLLAVESPLAQFVLDYETQPFVNHYVELSTYDREKSSSRRRKYSCAELVEQLVTRPDHTIVVLADYGAGKTTFLRRMKYLAAKRYLEHSSKRVPILFHLRNYLQYGSCEDFVLATLRSEINTDLTLQNFFMFLDSGDFLLLLDGFDEISLRTDAAERGRLLITLSPLLFGKSPAVLSTRPSYFLDNREYGAALHQAADRTNALARRHAADADERAQYLARQLRQKHEPNHLSRRTAKYFSSYDLELFGDREINEFLASYSAAFEGTGLGDWQAVRRQIDQVYDLSDLITRPIILTMIVDTILEGLLFLDEGLELGPTHLYEAYTQAKLDIDWDKADARQTGVSRKCRTAFAIQAALYMQEAGALEVPLGECRRLAQAIVTDPPEGMTSEHVLTDLRTCSFLTTTIDGTLRFVHRSFQEFFVAREIRSLIERDDWHLLLSHGISREVLYFVGAYLAAHDALRRAAVHHLTAELGRTSRNDTAIHNLASALLHTREAHSLRWVGVRIVGLVVQSLRVTNSHLERCTVDNARVSHLTLQHCVLDLTIDLERSESGEFVECTGYVRMTAQVDQLSFRASTMSIQLHSGRVGNLMVADGSAMTMESGRGAVEVDQADVVDSGVGLARVEIGSLIATRAGVDIDDCVIGPTERQPDITSQVREVRFLRSFGAAGDILGPTALCEDSLMFLRLGGRTSEETCLLQCVNSLLIVVCVGRVALDVRNSYVIALQRSDGTSTVTNSDDVSHVLLVTSGDEEFPSENATLRFPIERLVVEPGTDDWVPESVHGARTAITTARSFIAAAGVIDRLAVTLGAQAKPSSMVQARASGLERILRDPLRRLAQVRAQGERAPDGY
jgi:hypothetical protein